VNKRNRTVIAVAAIALTLLYFLPLWSIRLEAPQYPEGLGMRIWVNTITGVGPNDLQNINGLNHYIGMKTIEPESIPELAIMPWALGFLMILGLATAMAGRRWMLYGWLGLLIAAAIVGLADFYLWEYDYGHNLDPTAAIKIPGMAYQPPLVGSKMLLNFKATSLPALGGWIALAAGAVIAGVAFLELRASRRNVGRDAGAVLREASGGDPT
jgi:copper chaperone NosL